jgi:hypothetical protein
MLALLVGVPNVPAGATPAPDVRAATAAYPIAPTAVPATGLPTFGRPTISTIQGTGFEQGVIIDPRPNGPIYTHVPGTLSSGTSWIWKSTDGGKTFKWVAGSAPLTGKLPTCVGGGDTEVAIDAAGHLYFNDLTLANFSVARSDDGGKTFTPPSCISTATSPNDRQWYTTDGDPTNGGNLYLVYNIVGGDPSHCPRPGGTPDQEVANNVLVMARSPGLAGGATAGVAFAPSEMITAACQESIMGNVEVSPVTHRIFTVHPTAALDAVRVARCETVPFTTKPSGLDCVDRLVATTPGYKLGANFPTMAIDKAGNLFTVWEMATADADGNITGDTLLYFSSSKDEGETWTAPVRVPMPGQHNAIYAWMAAGSAGRVGIAWYGTPDVDTAASACQGPDGTAGRWSLHYSLTLNGTAAIPTFTPPVDAGEGVLHKASPWSLMGNQCGADRTKMGDFINLRMGPQGEANISFMDSRSMAGIVGQGMFVRQNGGTGLLGGSPSVSGPPAPLNSVTDPSGDGRWEGNGAVSNSMSNLDVLGSSVRKVGTSYRVTITVADLTSLAPKAGVAPGDDELVWNVQWTRTASGEPNHGRHYHVYMASTNGGAPRFYVGDSAFQALGGGVTTTYPGSTLVTGSYTPTAPGTITIDVPVAAVTPAGPVDATFRSVTASTMTLPEPAESVPNLGGVGGVFFNLVDVAPAYDFIEGFVTTAGHGHRDYSGNGKPGPGDVHIETTVKGGGSEAPTGTLVYDDLRGNPPGAATSNIRCTGTPTAVTVLGSGAVQITGRVACKSLSKAKTFEFTLLDNGANPPNADGFVMELFNAKGQSLYDVAAETTVGLGNLSVG